MSLSRLGPALSLSESFALELWVRRCLYSMRTISTSKLPSWDAIVNAEMLDPNQAKLQPSSLLLSFLLVLRSIFLYSFVPSSPCPLAQTAVNSRSSQISSAPERDPN